MTLTEKITTATMLSFKVQINALIATMDESAKDKFEKQLVNSMSDIYESFEKSLDPQDFKDIKDIAEPMIFRN
ncbi:MAG: hypothetical protein WBA61_03625 [Aequorivita sp.]